MRGLHHALTKHFPFLLFRIAKTRLSGLFLFKLGSVTSFFWFCLREADVQVSPFFSFSLADLRWDCAPPVTLPVFPPHTHEEQVLSSFTIGSLSGLESVLFLSARGEWGVSLLSNRSEICSEVLSFSG